MIDHFAGARLCHLREVTAQKGHTGLLLQADRIIHGAVPNMKPPVLFHSGDGTYVCEW